jgi:hypothetical protein
MHLFCNKKQKGLIERISLLEKKVSAQDELLKKVGETDWGLGWQTGYYSYNPVDGDFYLRLTQDNLSYWLVGIIQVFYLLDYSVSPTITSSFGHIVWILGTNTLAGKFARQSLKTPGYAIVVTLGGLSSAEPGGVGGLALKFTGCPNAGAMHIMVRASFFNTNTTRKLKVDDEYLLSPTPGTSFSSFITYAD